MFMGALEGCVESRVLYPPPKKSWFSVTTGKVGWACTILLSSLSTMTERRPFLLCRDTECHWPSFRPDPVKGDYTLALSCLMALTPPTFQPYRPLLQRRQVIFSSLLTFWSFENSYESRMIKETDIKSLLHICIDKNIVTVVFRCQICRLWFPYNYFNGSLGVH